MLIYFLLVILSVGLLLLFIFHFNRFFGCSCGAVGVTPEKQATEDGEVFEEGRKALFRGVDEWVGRDENLEENPGDWQE
jgi:hypothetical protein